LCMNPSCTNKGFSEDYDGDEFGETSDTSNSVERRSCSICERQEILSCSRCGRAFCEIHSSNSEKMRVQSPEHHIGTCGFCSFLVCEDCWVVNDNGKVICLNHLENGTGN
jgi:hypothetical protein